VFRDGIDDRFILALDLQGFEFLSASDESLSGTRDAYFEILPSKPEGTRKQSRIRS
jgi:hypothetical protein